MLSSVANPQIKNLLKLHQKKYRTDSNTFLVEGEHLISEAIMAGRLKQLIKSEQYEGEISYDNELLVSETVASKLSQTASGSRIFGVVSIELDQKLNGTHYLLCDQIQDPGNLGVMIRSAHSFGFDGVIVSNDSVDFYNDKVVRATQGALFHVALVRMDLKQAIKQLKQNGIRIVTTDVNRATSLKSVEKGPVALIVGNEGQGVSESLRSMSDFNVKIETTNFESLNVSVASGILMYHFRNE